jgi:RHS repeat-associated protein
MALLTNHSRHILPFAALLAFLAALGQEVVTFDGYYPYGAASNAAAASVQPLKYTGKELDRMNGLDHYDFGARWYDAARIGTTTTDPMASKYPHLSPYAWCAGNPVRNIDPSGRIIKTVINDVDYIFKEVDGVYGLYDVDGNKYEDQGGVGPGDIILFALQDLQKGYWGDLLVCYLANSPMTININQIEKTSFDEVPVNEISPTSLSIDWYPSDQGPKYLGDNGNYEDYRPSYIALGHEMAHAFDIINKSIDTSLWFKAGKNNQECYKGEIFATQFENILRRAFGIPRRSYYYYEDMGNGNYVPYEISKIPRMTHLPYQLLKLINPQLP